MNIILFIFCFFSINCYSQLNCDAGKDKVYCRNDSIIKSSKYPNNDTIGSSLTAWGGTPPYRYIWTCKDSSNFVSLGTKTASHFLNDSSISNPYLIEKNTYNYKVKFHLTVTDSLNSICKDSLILYGPYGFIAYGFQIIKCELDTIGPTVGIGGRPYPPYTYTWYPNKFISDTTISSPRFWPPISIDYKLVVTDSLGCQASIGQSIIIYCDSQSQISETKRVEFIINFHNPVNNNSVFYFKKHVSLNKIELYNSLGQLIYRQNSNQDIEIGKMTNNKGIFYLQVFTNDNKIQTYKIDRQ